MKIAASISTKTSLAQGSTLARPQFSPTSYEVLLFGKRPARLVDPRKFMHLKKAKRKVAALADEVAGMFGLAEGTIDVSLAEGRNASISRDGELRVGVKLLEEKEDDDDFLVALVGHEVGHQPWDWPTGDLGPLKRSELNALYRAEERKADDFMGTVLAKLGADPKSMEQFLLQAAEFEKAPPLDYDPAEQRVLTIRAAFERQLVKERRPTIAGIAKKVGRDLR